MHNGYGKWCYSPDINLGMCIKKHDHNSHGFQAKNQMDKSKYTQLTKMLLTKSYICSNLAFHNTHTNTSRNIYFFSN
jgi:hypothetical protein